MRRVVVTGMGLLSPLGSDLSVVWNRLVNGESGIGPVTRIDPAAYTSRIGGEIPDFDASAYVSPKEARRMDPFTLYAVGATQNAMAHSGINPDEVNRDRVGVIYGSGIGGLQILFQQSNLFTEKGPSRFSPFMIPQMITNIAPATLRSSTVSPGRISALPPPVRPRPIVWAKRCGSFSTMRRM